MIAWNPDQLAAITTRDAEILVAAAAGSGKTAVLVERVIRWITDEDNPTGIENLLVVTFTNAAAAEMRERISDALSEALERNPESGYLQRQLNLLSAAKIMTIHSLCLEIIRDNFHEIDLDPTFRIADETEIMLLKQEVVDTLFMDEYEAARDSFFHFLDVFMAGGSDERVRELVIDVFEFLRSNPWPLEWLKGKVSEFAIPIGNDLEKHLWGKALIEKLRPEAEAAVMSLEQAYSMALAGGLLKYAELLESEISSLGELVKVLHEALTFDWDTLREMYQKIEFERLPRAEKETDPADRSEVQELRNTAKKVIEDARKKIFNRNRKDAENEHKTAYHYLKELEHLVEVFAADFAAAKASKNIVDFNDLEHFALQILCEQKEGEIQAKPAAELYRRRFEEILIDEYQDSNLIQEIVLRTISREAEGRPNVFMVGDVKQSIYRFRQAKPELFLQKYTTYGNAGEYRRILLGTNYRSRGEIINGVNDIFARLMSTEAGELEYGPAEELVLPEKDREEAEDPRFLPELHILAADGSSFAGEESEELRDGLSMEMDEEALNSIQEEALATISRIREILADEDFYLEDSAEGKRRPEYRDIVILLRTTKNWAEIFQEELIRAGLPAFADGGGGFFRAPEVSLILSLLRIIDNPLQDIPLVAVLRSPMFGFTTDELAVLRLENKKTMLYTALEQLATEESELGKRASEFLTKLSKWREAAYYLPTDRLIWRIYTETGYFALVAALPDGKQRQANLLALYERAGRFEGTSYRGLFNFIRFVERMVETKGDFGSPSVLAENDNVIRIMSIHKSKGLEFPITIVAGLGKRFNQEDMRKSILLHSELGLGPDIISPELRLIHSSPAKEGLKARIKKETLAEEMRTLYVALTRACEKLILIGRVKNMPNRVASWLNTALVSSEKLHPSHVLNATTYLEWLVPTLLKASGNHELRKRLDFPESREDAISAGRGRWQVKFITLDELKNVRRDGVLFAETRLDDASLEIMPAEKVRPEIEEMLSWRYPYPELANLAAKYTVSELKRRQIVEAEEENPGQAFFGDEIILRQPTFIGEKKGFTAAEKGSLQHRFLQLIDFTGPAVEVQLEEMVRRELFTPAEAAAVELAKIKDFLATPLGQRLSTAELVRREQPFNLEVDAAELAGYEFDDRGKKVLVQGIIDCYFEEDGGYVLLDYKTDWLPPGGEETIKNRYAAQMEYYSRVLEELGDCPVKEKYLVMLASGTLIQV